MQSLSFLSAQRRFVATGLVVFGALLAFLLFPTDSRLNPVAQVIVSGAVFFLALPLLYVKLVLKEPIESIGFRGSERPFGWVAVPLVAIPALTILFLLIQYFSIADEYYLPTLARDSFLVFLAYELLLVGAITFLYEVFFRGFMQLFWLRKLGLFAAFVQASVFVAIVFIFGEASWQELPMAIAAFFSGFVAFYTRSIWYSWASSWLILFLADAYLLTLI